MRTFMIFWVGQLLSWRLIRATFSIRLPESGALPFASFNYTPNKIYYDLSKERGNVERDSLEFFWLSDRVKPGDLWDVENKCRPLNLPLVVKSSSLYVSTPMSAGKLLSLTAHCLFRVYIFFCIFLCLWFFVNCFFNLIFILTSDFSLQVKKYNIEIK